MALNQPALVAITPQTPHQNNNSFIKNIVSRSSFCGTPTIGSKSFMSNRKSWNGNGTMPFQATLTRFDDSPCCDEAPVLATFKSNNTLPKKVSNCELSTPSGNNNGGFELLTPNGNTGHDAGVDTGNELKRPAGNGHGRRYAEIGNWNPPRSSTFLEPHIQGIGRRSLYDADRQDEQSTEDDEQFLIRDEKKFLSFRKPKDNESEKSRTELLREKFEPKKKEDSADVQDGKKQALDRVIKGFRPIAPPDFRDSLSQSRDSLSSPNSGGSDADGDCECGSGTSSTGSSIASESGRVPCDIGLLERLVRTHPVWFLPGIQRAGAFHLLQGKEEGNFVVRQSSQTDTMALSVRLPPNAGPYIEHYLIHASSGRIGLETSQNKFDNIPDLVAHYSQCCDELPVQLILPRALREAKNRQQLSSLALLGQEFWRYPMSSPRSAQKTTNESSNNLKTPAVNAHTSVPTPMNQTPSETGSTFSNLSLSNRLKPENTETNVMLNLLQAESNGNHQPMSTFKGNGSGSPPNLTLNKPSNPDVGNFIRAPRPTPPNTLNLVSSTAHITQQSCPTPQNHSLIKNTPPPPPPRWAKPPFANSMGDIQAFSPMNRNLTGNANITVTTTVTFSVSNQQQNIQQVTENEINSPLTNNDSIKSDDLSSNHNNSFDSGHSTSSNNLQNSSKRLSPEGECLNTGSQQGSLRRGQNNQPDPDSPTSQNAILSPEPLINNFTPKNGAFNVLNQISSPNGSNSVTSGIFSPSQINSPSNATVSSKSGLFSPVSQVTSPALNKTDMFSPISRSSPMSNKSALFSPVSNTGSFSNNSSFNSPLMGKEREGILSPSTNTNSTTPSGRSRRSKHSMKKESRHYQESDILESPGIYYRSSVCDKVSDYEDIWGPEHGGLPTTRSTFKPQQNILGSGILVSKRPDLLPDTLSKNQNGNTKNSHSPTTTDNDSDKEHHQNTHSKFGQLKNFKPCSNSTEQINAIIATTNSKGEAVPKRPDKLNLQKNANEQMALIFENNEKLKLKEINNRTNEEIERENHKKNFSNDECSLLTSDFCNSIDDELQTEKLNSPFYADPVDAIKEVVAPLVQRRRLLKTSNAVGPAQRYSEPPTHGHPYHPLRDMQSIEELSPSSPNTSTSVDNLSVIKSNRPRAKAVLPPRIKPAMNKQDQTWTVDSSWEFINKQNEVTNNLENESKTDRVHTAFPTLAEQQFKLEASTQPSGDTLTIHQILAQKFPELNLSPYPTLLKSTRDRDTFNDMSDDSKGCRISSYENVEARLGSGSQISDDGTVFSEPWDCSQWDNLLPLSHDESVSIQSCQTYDQEEDDSSTIRETSLVPSLDDAPIRIATISRAKSFRDRLDPLLAPPRLQALRGARKGHSSGATGEGVRAYALHLAADKTTIFAQNVDNFISCTKESKETCPHVVMRNMRQFMSGMKNYLVKHGEREFEKEVEKERLKLKPNEFLNLDAILEEVLHGAVVTPLRSHVYSLLADRFVKRGDVALLTAGMKVARTLPPLRLGVRPSVRIPSEPELIVISSYLVKMQVADSPLDKLENLLAVISAIFNAMKAGTSSPIGADDFLPVLVLTLARCSVVGAELEAELMAGLLPPPLLAGEGGYYLTTLFGAVAVLKRLAAAENDKTIDWRSGSLGSGLCGSTCGMAGVGGVAKVLVPDEFSGAIKCVALPWRPGAKAKDLCRALAQRTRITNPQDYGLFTLRDGEETLLADTDCPQDLIGEKNISNCMLAYKRIDAKIAWPKQALQSFP